MFWAGQSSRALQRECSSPSYLPPSPTFSPGSSFGTPYHWSSFSPPQNSSLARFDSATYDNFLISGGERGSNCPRFLAQPPPRGFKHTSNRPHVAFQSADTPPLSQLTPSPFLCDAPLDDAAWSTFSMSDRQDYATTSYGGSSDFSSMTRHSSSSSRASSDATSTSRDMLDEGIEGSAAGGELGFRCSGCGWSTASEDLHQRHYHSHAAGEPFECFEAGCGAVFPHPLDFLEHSAREHGKRAREEDSDEGARGEEDRRMNLKRRRITHDEPPTLPATPELTPDQGAVHRNDAMDASSILSATAVSRTLSYGAMEHSSYPPRSLSLGGSATLEGLESSSILYASASLFKSRPSYCAEPGSAHLLNATPRSRPMSFSTSAFPSPTRSSYSPSTPVRTPPRGVALRRSDSAPINAVFRPPSHENFYSAPAAHPLHSRQHPLSPVSPTPNVGFAHRNSIPREQAVIHTPSEEHLHDAVHQGYQTRTPPSQTLPLSPSTPPHSTASPSLIYAHGSSVGFTPSQAALLSAQGMNRLLSGLPPPAPLAASFDSRPAPGFHPPPTSPQYMVTYRTNAPVPPPPPSIAFVPHVPTKSHHTHPVAKSHHAQPPPTAARRLSTTLPTSPSPTSPTSFSSPPRRTSSISAPSHHAPHGRDGGEAKKAHFCPEPTCQKAFKRLEHLRRHEKTHTSDKPFGCDWAGCGRYFSRSDNLTQHKKTHEKIGGRNGPPTLGKALKLGTAS